MRRRELPNCFWARSSDRLKSKPGASIVTEMASQRTRRRREHDGPLVGSVEPLAAPPLVIGEQDCAQLGELRRRILERREHQGALVEREPEQLHLVGNAALETVGQVVGASSPDERIALGNPIVAQGRSIRSNYKARRRGL
jgi:hypothetical protein